MLQQIAPGLHVSPSIFSSNIIAGFDLDWTLIRSARGRFFKDEDDWKFLPNRLLTLKSYQDSGYTLAIFTNQGYKGAKLTSAINRINNIIKYLQDNGINIFVLAATGDNSPYRKPNNIMWQVLTQGKEINYEKSIYVGDAAGRPGDHSDDDFQFAKNIGIKFYTPEEIFPINVIDIPKTQTMFIFVGMPGSGKSTFYNKYLQPLGWIHANQDTLKTREKVIKLVETSLANGKSVAVDGTNPNKRADFINLAIKYQVPTMILYFVSNGYDRNKLRSNPVPDIAYSIYFKNLIEPSQEIDGVPVLEISY